MIPEVDDLEPELPDALSARAEDCWEPLIALADLAGATFGKRARETAVALACSGEEDGESLGVRLLLDIRRIFELTLQTKLFTSDLLDQLNALEESPWGEYGRRRSTPGLKAGDLSRLLRDYGVRSQTVRVGSDTKKGYRREDFVDAWDRYLPEEGSDPSHRHNGEAPDPGDAPGDDEDLPF